MFAFICYAVGSKKFRDYNLFLIQMTTMINNPQMEIKLSDIFFRIIAQAIL